MRATGRMRGGARITFDVHDISLAGCLVETRSSMAKLGDHLLLMFGDLEPIPAEVLWVEDQRLGIGFDNLLHETVLERLTRQIA